MITYKRFVLLFFVLLMTQLGLAQEKTVTGTVLDNHGMPLPAVNIVIKGETVGTSTDFDGNYTITVLQGQTLLFSSVGFEDIEVTVGTDDVIDVSMQEGTMLDEVVVVGYGTQKRVNATGAVTTIDSKILEDRPMSRLSQGLQGAVANLNITTNSGAPNATQSINIRGYTGLGSSAGPLVVIDGIQAGDINAINPSDVESITIIKDAAAAAVYGSSAPYGVILINTKQGKKGRMQVSYNNTTTLKTPIGMPKMMNSLEHALIYNEAARNAGGADIFSQETMGLIKQYLAGEITDETRPSPNSDSWLYWGGGNANNDWFDIFYKDVQVVQQHSLSVSGGTEKSHYYMGLGYNENPGMLRFGDDVYRRYNVRANLSTQINDWLEVKLRTYYSKEAVNAPWGGGNRTGGNWMHQIARKWPSIPLYTPETDNAPRNYAEVSDAGFMEEGGRHIEDWDKPTITGEIVLTPVKGLTATVNYTYSADLYNTNDHVKTVYYPQPSGKLDRIDWTYPNSFSRSFGSNKHRVFNAFATYELDLGLHNFKLLGGYVREDWDNLSFSGGNTNLFTDNVPSISTAYGEDPWVSDSRSQLATEGVFGRFNYNFDEKYLLEVTGRYDGSSRFLKDSRWRFYPGVSAGWNISREDFWEDLNLNEIFNAFKLRGSYGSLGDQSAVGGWYPFYPSLSTSAPTSSNWYYNGSREVQVNPPGLVNPDITWVTTNTLDFGVDISALRNRLTVEFDWYKRNAKDYLGPTRDYPAILGANPPQENAAAMETKGFELSMTWKGKIGEANYSFRGNLSNYNGYVTRFPNDLKLLSNWFEGEKMGDIYGYKTVGFFQSDADVAKAPDQSYIHSNWGPGDIQYEDLNGDGKIDIGTNRLDDMGDLTVIGNSTPQYQFGLFGSFDYRSLDFSFFLHGVGKRDIMPSGSVNYFWGFVQDQWQSSPFTTHRDRWTPSNPDGYFPKYYMSNESYKNYQSQTKYMQSAAYLRLKNIEVGYTIPKEALAKLGVERFRIFGMVENIATFSKLSKHSTLDPETFKGDMKIYPLQRGFSFGVNVTF